MDKKSNPYYSQAVQKILNKCVANEFMLAAVFNGLYAATPANIKNYVEETYLDIANDKLLDHYMGFVKFGAVYGLPVPLDVGTMNRYASDKILRAFNHIKKDQKSSYYIELACGMMLESVKAYEEALYEFEKDEDYDDFGNFKGILLKNYSDELESIEKLELLAFNNVD